jgi:hypothetical protein
MRKWIYPQLITALDSKIDYWKRRKRRAELEGDDMTVVIAGARLAAYKEVRRWVEPWIEAPHDPTGKGMH